MRAGPAYHQEKGIVCRRLLLDVTDGCIGNIRFYLAAVFAIVRTNLRRFTRPVCVDDLVGISDRPA